MALTDLKVLIVRRGVRQIDVAAALGMSDGQLSKILSGAKPEPEGFEAQFRIAVDEVAAKMVERLLGTDQPSAEADPQPEETAVLS